MAFVSIALMLLLVISAAYTYRKKRKEPAGSNPFRCEFPITVLCGFALDVLYLTGQTGLSHTAFLMPYLICCAAAMLMIFRLDYVRDKPCANSLWLVAVLLLCQNSVNKFLLWLGVVAAVFVLTLFIKRSIDREGKKK